MTGFKELFRNNMYSYISEQFLKDTGFFYIRFFRDSGILLILSESAPLGSEDG